MKYLAICLFALMIGCNSAKRDGYTITGQTSDLPDSTLVFLTELEFTKEKPDFVPKIVDSTFIINNKFLFQGNIDSEYQIMVLRLKDFSQYKYLWVENNEMTFDASNSTFRYAKISGSKIQDQASEHFAISDPFEVKLDSIEGVAEATGLMAETRTEKEDSLRSVLFEAYQQIEIAQREAETVFVKSNPDYELSPFILLFLQNYISEDIVKELYEGLSEDVKQNVFSAVVKDHIINSLKLEIGQKAPNIILPDVQGNELSLSDFASKYVLIDFWSSTCGPCRLENKNLLKAYEEFGERGFEIFSISLDTEKSKWKAAMEKDKMIWASVSDLQGRNGKYPVMYDISSIPTNYLLNPKGEIIDKYIRGNDLIEKLKSIFP